MTEDAPNIKNAHLVTEVFGYWPSFHDAEVKSIGLDRAGFDTLVGPIVEMLIHVFEMTERVTTSGAYELMKHHLVQFRFSSVSELKLEDFNHQNAIFGLGISDMTSRGWEGPRLQVTIDSAFGVAASFYCCNGEVLSVTPCGADGETC